MATVTYEPGFGGPSEIEHGQTVTITGLGFGLKPAAPPVMWDNATGPTSPLDIWDAAWPNQSWNVARNEQMARRGIIRGVQPPHARTGRYICGAHNLDGHGSSANGGNAVVIWKAFPAQYPIDIYQSCWMRCDPGWTFSATNDNNLKGYKLAYTNSPATSPMAGAVDSITVGNPVGWNPTSISDTSIKYHIYGEIVPTHFGSVTDTANVMSQWTKIEILWSVRATGGFIRVYENGRLADAFGVNIPDGPQSLRTVSFGDFARQNNFPSNWRYYTDCYLDSTFARVMLVSDGEFSGGLGITEGIASVRELQIPIAWSATSIQFQVNLGAFETSGSAQLYVVDSTNTPIKVATVALDDVQPGLPPEITSAPVAAGVETVAFNYQITATPAATSFDAENLPGGLGVNVTTGAVTGDPSVTGDSIVDLSASSAAGTGEAPLALVIRPVIPAVGTGEKPTQIGAQPEPSHPLTADLVASWLFNEGDDITPAATLVNGGSGGSTYDVTMDYSDVGNYEWIPNVETPATWDLQVRTTGTGESPITLANPLTTTTTWTWECRWKTPGFGGNSVPIMLGNDGSIYIANTSNSVRINPLLRYGGANHSTSFDGSIADGTEYSVVWSVNAGVGTCYINGVERTPTFSDVPSMDFDRMWTNLTNIHTTSFVGDVQVMRVWVGRALTPAEVSDLTIDPYAMYGSAVPEAPVISSSLTAVGDVGQPFVYGIVASPLPDEYDAIGLPAGLLIDQTLGVIYGTPEVGTAGNHNVTIEASNNVGTDDETLVLTINAAPTPPIITSDLFASARVGEPFSYQIVATESPTSFDATPLPAGLTVNTATGLIDGTPTEDGLFDVPISATNADGTDQETLALTIDPPFAVPVITSPLTASGTVGVPFDYTITADGEPAPDTFGAVPLPTGLVLDPEIGVISGTPTVDGETPVDISATNEAGTGNATLVITIAAVPVETPEITSPLNVSAQLGQPFSYQISATNDPFEFSATNLPLGLAVNTTTGIIDGTPLEMGSFGVTISATNGAGDGPPALLTIVISLDEPAIISSLTASTVINQLFSYQIIATFPASVYAATDLPPDLVLNTATGRISGTVLQPGVYSITISAASVVPDEEATAVLVLTVLTDEPIPEGPIFIQPWHRPLG